MRLPTTPRPHTHLGAARSAPQTNGGIAATLAALLLLSPLQMLSPSLPQLAVQPAYAKELASGSGSKVNKDPLSLLRLGLPGQPKEVRELQANLEEAQDTLSRLLYGKAQSATSAARGTLKGKGEKILAAVPAASKDEAKTLLASMDESMSKMEEYIAVSKVGPATAAQSAALTDLSKLEGLIAAVTKPVPVPSEFKALPQLTKRATVEFTVKKGGNEQFDIDGNLFKEGKLTMLVDGYTAPVTGGNFVDLVQRGFYDGMKIQRSDGFVVQTGDPSQEGRGKDVGFKPDGSDAVRNVPLEVFVKGDKGPIYGSTFDDDGRGGYAATLPFNAYGALGMAREEYSADSASSQFFWLLFDSDLTPAGKNLLDGRYACFGYTIDGARFLSDLKEGDIIVKATVTSGAENLVQPS